jgi:hypothetical protein
LAGIGEIVRFSGLFRLGGLAWLFRLGGLIEIALFTDTGKSIVISARQESAEKRSSSVVERAYQAADALVFACVR